MDAKQIVAKNIKSHRKQLGLSQRDLSKKSKLSIRYISYLENAEPNVTLDVLVKVAKGLSITLAQLVYDGEFEEKPTKRDRHGLDYAIKMLNLARDKIGD